MLTYNLLSAPASEPLSLADVKAWLKIDNADEDALLSALLTSARLSVEAATGLMLITQTWRLALDAWPDGNLLTLSHAPVQALQAIRVYDASGIAQPLATTLLSMSRSMREPRFSLTGNLPSPGRAIGGIELDLIFGYGNDGSSVPEPLKLAIKLLIAFWHENRGDDVSQAAVKWPDAISSLLSPFMLRRF